MHPPSLNPEIFCVLGKFVYYDAREPGKYRKTVFPLKAEMLIKYLKLRIRKYNSVLLVPSIFYNLLAFQTM